VLSADDHDAVHHRYDPAFGPWRSLAVGYADDQPLALLPVRRGGGPYGSSRLILSAICALSSGGTALPITR
jgi:hypothetical protein